MSEIFNILRARFPNADLRIPDGEYEILPRERVEKLLRDCFYEQYKYVLEKFDCDDYALMFHAFCVQERYREAGTLSWAIGEAWGKFRHTNGGGHACNIAVVDDEVTIFKTERKIVLIEPYGDDIIEVSDEDEIDFIRM